MTAPDPLRSVVATIDRLRSPGGCPWDAEQTHESLLPFAIEEVYEVVEAIETGDRAGLREELGDLLTMVLFFARIAADHPTEPFGIDDVAADLDAKLRRRHPHVFDADGADVDGAATATSADVAVRWDAMKAVEKGRASVLDGVPSAMPALARAQKIASRARRGGLVATPSRPVDHDARLGEHLLMLVREADAAGVDAEGALRQALRHWEQELRADEHDGRGSAPEA